MEGRGDMLVAKCLLQNVCWIDQQEQVHRHCSSLLETP